MLKVILFSIFTSVVILVNAQVQTQVIGDSVFVHSNTGTSELILQNSTDTVNGFLFNKGAGRTEFRKALIKINDSTYLVGADTLHLNNAGTTAWSLTGNAGTSPSVNFLGTTDNTPLNFRVNNALAGSLGTITNNNVSFGTLSLPNTSTGIQNTALGGLALGKNTTGVGNAATGYGTLYNNTSGNYNTSIGYLSLDSNTVGIDNTANGAFALSLNTTGINNTANGAGALYVNTTGNHNTSDGYLSLSSNTTGNGNTANGAYSLHRNTTGTFNTGNGYNALWSNTTGNSNIANGTNSLYSNITGNYNIGIGHYALFSNMSGISNTGIGISALINATSSFNTAIGDSALYSLKTGYYDIGLGYEAGGTSSTTSSNTFYISDSAYHMYYKLDSATGTAPSVIGKDASGFWHVYQAVGSGFQLPALTSGSVLFSNGSTISQDSSNFFWDNNNKRLGIGTNSPSVPLEVRVNGLANALSLKSATGAGILDFRNANSNTTPVAQINAFNCMVNLYNGLQIRRPSNNGTVLALANPSAITIWNAQSDGRTMFGSALAPSAFVHIIASSGTAGTAPIKLNPGVKLAIPEVGAIENDSTTNHLYWTDKLGTRYQLDNQQVSSPISLTTIGTTGPATLINNTLNVPNYSAAIGNIPSLDSVVHHGDSTTMDIVVNGTTVGLGSGNVPSNTATGPSALYSNTTGYRNTALGALALYFNTTGFRNTAVGDSALYFNTTGYRNVALGQNALNFNTTGFENTALGTNALHSNKTGSFNSALGMNALYSNATGNYNLALGEQSLQANTSGSSNIGIGQYALALNSSGLGNIAIGHQSLMSLSSGNYNIGLGYNVKNSLYSSNNTMYISDSTTHFYFNLDSATGTPSYVIGKDVNGFWHTYTNSGGSSSLVLTAIGTSGAATLTNNTLNIPNYTQPIATSNTTGVVSVGLGLAIDSTGKLSATTALLKPGSVPYAGSNGILIQDTTGLVYDGNNLQVGHSDFYNTVGLYLNGGRGRLTASGFGLTIATSGGMPMDASKSISFYNSSTRYGVMSMRSVSDSTLRFLSDMEIVPSATNKLNLGSYSNQWDTVFAKQLYVNGALVNGGINLTTIGTTGPATLIGDTLNVPNYANNSWSLTGNAGTIAGTNFIGTTDNVELMFMVNNVLAGRTGKGSFSNTSFGAKSQPITGTGLFNAAFGTLASAMLSSGAKNTDIGYEAGFNNLTGNFNTRVGEGANIWDTSSSYNAVLGTEALNYSSLAKIAGGGYNTALGSLALNKHAAYRGNIGLGFYAGNGLTGNNTLFVSDSAYHMYFKLDSAVGTGPNIIGKDANGYWHTYQAPTYGMATLSSGTVTISTTAVKAGAKIFISCNTPSGTQGFLSAPTGSIIDGTSFVINSTSATDNSTVNYQIINP